MIANFELGKSAVVVTHKVLPKKPTSAYFFFNQQYIKNVREKDAAITQTEGAKLAGTKWGTMSEKEKTPFEKQATDDKVRFDKQTKELETKGFFKMDDGTKSTDPANAHLAKKDKTKSKDDDEPEALQPKRPMSAYMYFNVEFSSEIRAKNPGVVMAMGEVSKLVSERWNAMSDVQK